MATDSPCPFLCGHDGDHPEPTTSDTVESTPRRARGLYDLPIFGWAWKEDGRDLRA